VRTGDVGPPTLVERNQVVPLIYLRGGLEIMTEGRSLDRAGIGDHVRVMNLASRATVSGRVTARGQILVSQ
jgi:flagella basal body P-ring formation protein FlgA